VSAVDGAVTKSLGQVAYEHLREAIENGRLKPGDRVSVNGLAEMMSLSRTPVREAISWLETDGLIAYEPTLGRVIASLDHQMVNELSAIRVVLEATGVGLAARNASAAEIEVLRDMLVIEKSILSDPVKRERQNRRFHEAIHRCAHNRYLISTLSALQTPMLLLGPATASEPARLEVAYGEHVELVDAIARHDAEKAQEIITRHLVTGQRVRIKHILEKMSDHY
jgi:DNA-binding GntR family transcriptional regulator